MFPGLDMDDMVMSNYVIAETWFIVILHKSALKVAIRTSPKHKFNDQRKKGADNTVS